MSEFGDLTGIPGGDRDFGNYLAQEGHKLAMVYAIKKWLDKSKEEWTEENRKKYFQGAGFLNAYKERLERFYETPWDRDRRKKNERIRN